MNARTPTHDDVERVASILADAFFHDPVWAWAFSDETRRREQQLAWFTLVVAQALDNGSVWVTPGFEAAAVWVPPGKLELDEVREAQLEAALRELCGDEIGVVLELFALFEQNHPRDPDLHYLSLLATADAHRGKGIGTQLLRQRLDELDELGAPAYLESTNPANLTRYEAVGFRPYGSFQLHADGPVVTTMWRDPQPSTARG